MPAPPCALVVAHGCWVACVISITSCAVLLLRFSDLMWPLIRDLIHFVFQTLVIKVSGVILSVVGGLAVGKVTELEEHCLGLSPTTLYPL